MAEALKDRYSISFYDQFSEILTELIPHFEPEAFKAKIFAKGWEEKELKDRMYHTSEVLNTFFPANFQEAAELILKCIQRIRKSNLSTAGFEFMFFPDYIEKYGMSDFEIAMEVMPEITKFASCEFAVRRFILANPERSMELMTAWSLDENLHVRRLASEGCRPRLPWAVALPDFKKNPEAVLPILENLKNDPSEYVRRSVANNLNDISKDNPEIALGIFEAWYGETEERNKLVKHGARTLLKKGDNRALHIFGLGPNKDVSIQDIVLKTPKVRIGEYLDFEFTLVNKGAQANLRLEYAIHYLLNNGELSKKVFKISEKEYAAKSENRLNRKQSFKIISTRRYYTGKQALSIIVNGVETALFYFDLVSE